MSPIKIVLKSGPRKPKLDNVSLSQWIVANLAILYKLQGESKLTGEGLLDYLLYTIKICQLVQRYSLTSVLLYDREHRKLQSAHGFHWGTDVPHLQSVYLQSSVCVSAILHCLIKWSTLYPNPGFLILAYYSSAWQSLSAWPSVGRQLIE